MSVIRTKDVKQISQRDHIKNRSMWAGSHANQEQDIYIVVDGDHFEHKELKFPPAMEKCIDEIVVNAIDHYVNFPDLVKNIKILFADNGEISVFNDGPGIFVKETQNLNKEVMYTPQLIFAEYMSSSNFDDENERVVGGQNGLGAKITSVHSEYFTVETCDIASGYKYTQTFRDGLLVIEKPVLKKIRKSDKSYTKITFMLNYNEFKFDPVACRETLYKIIEARAWHAAAYTGIKVEFNDQKIRAKSFRDYCVMYTDDGVHSMTMTRPDGKYPWDICVGFTDGKEKSVSLINGIYIKSGGTHIKFIQKYLLGFIKPLLEKELKKNKVGFNRNVVINNLFIFMKGPIPNPEFLSQTKDAVVTDINTFKNYAIEEGEMKKLWTMVKPNLLAAFIKKQIGEEKKRVVRGAVVVPKYEEAANCRNAKLCHQCGLIVAEGDSAISAVRKGLLSKHTTEDFSFTWFGTYSLQGVIVNGLRESTELTSGRSKKDEFTELIAPIGNRLPGQKVLNNERLSSLTKVLGLDYNKKYNFTQKGETEYKSLRYGFIVGLTDQDLDGFNIFGLLITYFMTYWPALVKRGFIRRIQTPIFRAYPNNKKKPVKEFYTEKDIHDWVETLGEAKVKSMYTTKYYKGLGSHSEEKREVTQMFRNINTKICEYQLDKDSVRNMFVYYGKETSIRKNALREVVNTEISNRLKVPISEHFGVSVKSYQIDNISRKISAVMDGLVDCRRKILHVTRDLQKSKEVKIPTVAGYVLSKTDYHHGDATIAASIVKMAQIHPCARELPLLLPRGMFGDYAHGFSNSASPRYLSLLINKNLTDKLFRKEDDFILQYKIIEGKRYEPVNYAPVIPYALAESDTIPGTGWKMQTHARRINDLINNTRRLISGEITECGELGMSLSRFNGRFTEYKGKTYFVGEYSYDDVENTIHIQGLPIDKYSYYYIEGSDSDIIKKKGESKKDGIKYKEHVESVQTLSDDVVDIIVKLKPGAADEIMNNYGNEVFDAFEEYFGLKCAITHNINFIDTRGTVIEFRSYEDAFMVWYEYRKNLYSIRVEREIILTNLMIEMLLEQQRFSREHKKYGLTTSVSEDKANLILNEHKYKIFNREKLIHPAFTEIKELVPLITLAEYGATYKYLLDMSYYDKLESAYTKRQAKIEELKNRLNYLTDDANNLFVGANVWLQELSELENAINIGKASGWKYGEDEYIFED